MIGLALIAMEDPKTCLNSPSRFAPLLYWAATWKCDVVHLPLLQDWAASHTIWA